MDFGQQATLRWLNTSAYVCHAVHLVLHEGPLVRNRIHAPIAASPYIFKDSPDYQPAFAERGLSVVLRHSPRYLPLFLELMYCQSFDGFARFGNPLGNQYGRDILMQEWAADQRDNAPIPDSTIRAAYQPLVNEWLGTLLQTHTQQVREQRDETCGQFHEPPEAPEGEPIRARRRHASPMDRRRGLNL